MEMTDLMLDLETVATGPNAAILSLSAVLFRSSDGLLGREFNRHVDLQSCIDAGLDVDADTLLWWISQGEEARQRVIQGQKYGSCKIASALELFWLWYRETLSDYRVKVWGNGPSFDCAIMANLYKKVPCGRELPWSHWNERCVRTVVDLAGGKLFKNSIPFEGVKHDALDDCKHQIKLVCAGLKKIGGC